MSRTLAAKHEQKKGKGCREHRLYMDKVIIETAVTEGSEWRQFPHVIDNEMRSQHMTNNIHLWCADSFTILLNKDIFSQELNT